MFRKVVQELEWGWCVECNTRFPGILAKGICGFCKKDKEKHPEGSLYSAANKIDPGMVPEELSRLTDLKKLLIAHMHPLMSGNVINFVHDVSAIATVLPCKPKDLSVILIVKRTATVLPCKPKDLSQREFVVRREYVRQALVWLKDNHIYYKDITISYDNIDGLPENDVPDDLPHLNENLDQQVNSAIFF
ncbi:hypothetical protein MKX01_026920 [Papaver californicum]|nr:hypothetical protein MKX01_026920 [Papaver californicum]